METFLPKKFYCIWQVHLAENLPQETHTQNWIKTTYKGMYIYGRFYRGGGGVSSGVLTQSGRFFCRFWIFGQRSVWTLPKSWSPPILDMENSKIKVSWPNKTVTGLSEVPNTRDFQGICCYWSGVRTGFSRCLARCSNILTLWQKKK